jgi:hypothetical protein
MQTNQKHQKIHENIIVFSFDNKYTYNPQKWLIEEKEFTIQKINEIFNRLFTEKNILFKMSKNAGNIAIIDATSNLSKLVN